jgi:integrase
MRQRNKIISYRGKWCARIWVDGTRHRVSLGNIDATPEGRPAAERAFADLEKELAKPKGDTLAELFQVYRNDTDAISVARMDDAWKALLPHFGSLKPEHITKDRCKGYIEARRALGRKDGTIRKELSVLRAAVNSAGKGHLSVFYLPPPPPPKDRWLSREEFDALLAAARPTFHLTVFLHLAIATAGRKEALLEMQWSQVDWKLGQVSLGHKPGGKSRPVLPMTADSDPIRPPIPIPFRPLIPTAFRPPIPI